jgi:hypothetical protein
MSDVPKRQQGYAGCAGLIAAFVAGAVVGSCVSNILTRIAVQQLARQKQYENERDAVAPTIAKDPAFRDVHVYEDSEGFAWVAGKVPTAADKKRLQDVVTRAIGERRATRQTSVEVEGTR